MSKIEVDSITQQSGTTLTVGGGSGKTLVADAATVTLGRCGGTVALASGASQTGFGRTGTVDWQTTIKTGDFTAVSGEGYFVDTTSGEIDVTLPSSPSAGDIVAVSDYAKNFDTNNCIMLRNGSNIQGSANNLTLSAEGLAMTFVYADSTKGWIVVGAGRVGDKTTGEFIQATGGTITEDGDCKVHTFTGPGTFTVSAVGNASGSNSVNYLVIAGGGGGGQRGGGGGGAGGHRSNFPVGGASGLPVSVQGYPITVGGGGAGAAGTPGGNKGGTGVNSVFSSITSAGGGGGGRWPGPPNPGDTGDPGGSGGGGGSGFGGAVGGAGGTGNSPPVSPPQGNNGGSAAGVSSPGGTGAGAGGGGIGAVGGNTPGVGIGGAGGCGTANSITGSPVTRAGGGGGGAQTTAGAAGPGGGGAGTTGTCNGGAGTTNTGGGGGGARNSTDGGTILGGNGGSGIVIIRYKYQ